jgi:hypothetical protein
VILIIKKMLILRVVIRIEKRILWQIKQYMKRV